jgi:D-sedoheptulose 7-phosphate isomerase
MTIKKIFTESIAVKEELILGDELNKLEEMGQAIAKAIKNGKKLMLCGNGGSAADAQHLAAEMLVRLRPDYNREGIPAISLAQDTSTITACGNDFGYDYLYERMVCTLGRKSDIFIGISTSGKSENIILAMKAAKKMGITVFGFLGSGGGPAKSYCDISFTVPSYDTGRIQEAHITAGHALMENIEDKLIEEGVIHLKKKI